MSAGGFSMRQRETPEERAQRVRDLTDQLKEFERDTLIKVVANYIATGNGTCGYEDEHPWKILLQTKLLSSSPVNKSIFLPSRAGVFVFFELAFRQLAQQPFQMFMFNGEVVDALLADRMRAARKIRQAEEVVRAIRKHT